MAGVKYDKGKAPISLIPSEAILGIAEGLGYGAGKYGKHNFREGIEYTRLCDSLMRHMLAFIAGVDIDEESGIHHIKLVGANYSMLMHMLEHHQDRDDRYKKTVPEDTSVVKDEASKAVATQNAEIKRILEQKLLQGLFDNIAPANMRKY